MPLSEIVLVIMLLLGAGMVVAGLTRRLPVPYTVLLVLLGALVGNLGHLWPPLEVINQVHITPELVLFIFLPALIFESGLNLNARQLVRDMGPVLTLAVPALLFSTLAIGGGLWLLLPIEPATAFVFGALISATDPVAVVALFKELGTPERLTVLVEGESLLNDATAIVVFKILLGMALLGSFEFTAVGGAVLEFLKVFLGGALVGIVGGLACGQLMSRLQLGAAGVMVLSLVLAYAGFVVAEHTLHLSGVMAVATGAVTLGAFAVPRLPRETVTALGELWAFLALAANTLLFLLVGMAADYLSIARQLDGILIALLLVLAARASMVYSLVPFATRVFGLPRVTLGERHIMWWGGLKGGLALAIALSIPEDLAGRQVILDLTLGVVLFTLLVNAPTIRPLIKALGLHRLSADEGAELKRAVGLVKHHATGTLERLAASGLLSPRGGHQAASVVDGALTVATPVTAAHQHRRYRKQTLRVELEALEELFKGGIIPQYTFLDLRGELRRKQDEVAGAAAHRHKGPPGARRANPFLRLEDTLVRWLREHDWAAPLLSRLQGSRTTQHLLKDMARILMAEAALAYVRGDGELPASYRAELVEHYEGRAAVFRARVADIRRDYPAFFGAFEGGFALRAALAQAGNLLESERHHGSISPKPFKVLEQRLTQAATEVAPLANPVAELETHDLLAGVPLLGRLPAQALDPIAARATTVSFLVGDTIIAEGAHGDALYVVARGRVAVSHRGDDGQNRVVAELGAGEFFGETALLGDSVRTATVTALRPCSLVRLGRRDVLQIAEDYPEVEAALEAARQARSGRHS